MSNTANTAHDQGSRAQRALVDVLPRSAVSRVADPHRGADLIVNGQPLQVEWVGEGHLRDVRPVIARREGAPDVVVGRQFSPGAREALSAAGIGWVDETGAAEIAVATIVVSRTGRPVKGSSHVRRWTPAVMAVAEALLCGTQATVAATVAATGLSTGSCANALRFLTERGLLEADAPRGRGSARRVTDPDRLLDAYATAVEAAPANIAVEVGVHGRDLLGELVAIGRRWDETNIGWATTGAAAATVLAPYLTAVNAADVYVAADTIVGLEARAGDAGLRPLDGGRLTLRPFPTVAVSRLSDEIAGLHVAPWPRVYADLRTTGVRGEEAAEHLREVMHAG